MALPTRSLSFRVSPADNLSRVKKFVMRPAGRLELERDEPPDFDSMTIAQLRMRLTTRGCAISGLAPNQYAARLRSLWMEWKGIFGMIRTEEHRQEFREERTAMYAQIWQMSESRFEADRTRKSFSDLPGEIRNMVYGLALFDEPEGNYASASLWPITLVFRADGHYLQPKRTRAYQKCSSLQELRHDRTLSTMGMLAALNKQTRHEIRTFFWSRISVTIAVQSAQAVPPPMYFRYLIRFLKEIGRDGRDGRAALSDLRATNMSLKYESASPRHWQSLTKSLRQCLNLCELELCLSVDVLFGHATDHNALRTYFLHGKALNSPSLAGLFTFFQGFPRLRVLKLHTAPDRPGKPMAKRQESDDFLHFAFTGNREKRLVQEIRDQLQNLQGVQVEVISGREHVDDFEEWKKWQPGCAP
jgi:hypothetical protein